MKLKEAREGFQLPGLHAREVSAPSFLTGECAMNGCCFSKSLSEDLLLLPGQHMPPLRLVWSNWVRFGVLKEKGPERTWFHSPFDEGRNTEVPSTHCPAGSHRFKLKQSANSSSFWQSTTRKSSLLERGWRECSWENKQKVGQWPQRASGFNRG